MIEPVRLGGAALQVFIGCVPMPTISIALHISYPDQATGHLSHFSKARIFFWPCWAFQPFYPRSPKVLDKILTHTLPTSGNDRWNLYSWAINTMFENIYCFENIVIQVTLTPVPSEMMKPWPRCWIIRTLSSFRNLLSHHVTCGSPLCQVLGEEHFITIVFLLFDYYCHDFSLSFTNILFIPSVNKSVALCH